MKGQQNFRNICQRVNCDQQLLNRIEDFEQNPYTIAKDQQIDGFIQYKIPSDECVSLQDLFDAIKFQYVVIYKGQAILIIQAVLEHLLNMVEKKIDHYELNLNNIFIKLKQDSNKFTTYQSIIEIDKIYFVNYLTITDPNKQNNDMKNIKQIIVQFLELYQDQNFKELITKIKNSKEIKEIKEAKWFRKLKSLVNDFINEFVDQTTQNIRIGEIENYNKITKQRKFCESELLTQLQVILNDKTQFQIQILDETEEEKQKQLEKLKEQKELEVIQNYILNQFQPSYVKTFQRYYGDKLQNSYLITGITKKYQTELFDLIYLDQQRLNRIYENTQIVIKECIEQSKQIKAQLLQDFKFEVDDLSLQIIYDLYQKFYIRYSTDFDMTKEESYKTVNSIVKENVIKFIQEHYEQEVMLKILEIIDDLI